MTLAILNEVVDQQHCNEQYCNLEAIKVEGHGIVAETAPTDDNHERENEQSDLHTGSDGNTNCKIHLVFDCDGDSGSMFWMILALLQSKRGRDEYLPAAFPTMGTRIRPTNSSEMLPCSTM